MSRNEGPPKGGRPMSSPAAPPRAKYPPRYKREKTKETKQISGSDVENAIINAEILGSIFGIK